MSIAPPVSVVIPAHNSAGFISEALDSALGQNYPNVEMIVVDDGSRDHLADVLLPYRSRVLLVQTKRGGPGRARNIGVEAASGEFIQFLDADDVLLPGKVRVCVERSRMGVLPFMLKEHVVESRWPERMAKYKAEELVETDGHKYRASTSKATLFAGLEAQKLALTFPIGTEAPLHDRQTLLSIGGFREDLWNCEDVELHFRLALQGIDFEEVDEIGVLVRRHRSSLRHGPRRNEMGAKAAGEMSKMYQDRGGDDAQVQALLADRLAYYGFWCLIQGYVESGRRALATAHRLSAFPRPFQRPALNLLFRHTVSKLFGLRFQKGDQSPA